MNSTVSTPPLNSDKPQRPVTFADVAMKLVQDGPIYMILATMLIAMLYGKADAKEATITGLAALLARMWPAAVQVAGKVGAQVIIVLAAGLAFSATHMACTPRPVAYGVELANCTDKSKTLTESITCENGVRARYGRPLRDAGVE